MFYILQTKGILFLWHQITTETLKFGMQFQRYIFMVTKTVEINQPHDPSKLNCNGTIEIIMYTQLKKNKS